MTLSVTVRQTTHYHVDTANRLHLQTIDSHMLLLLDLVTEMLSALVLFRNYSLNLLNGVLLVKVIRLPTYLMFVMKNCFLLCVIGLTIACIILLSSERDTGHDLRRRGHSCQLVCYNFSSTRRCFVIRMLYVI